MSIYRFSTRPEHPDFRCKRGSPNERKRRPCTTRHGLNVFWIVVPPASSHPFRVVCCDLKQNFAVWQPYALSDFHFPIDCVFEALPSAPAKPCGLPKQPENARSLGLVRFCGSYLRQRYAFSRQLHVAVPIRRMSKLGARSRQGYAFKRQRYALKHMCVRHDVVVIREFFVADCALATCSTIPGWWITHSGGRLWGRPSSRAAPGCSWPMRRQQGAQKEPAPE